MIEVGADAPGFTLLDQDENERTLEELRGDGKLFLAFYPMDFSPVCSDQFSQYEPHLREIDDLGASVVAVGVDSAWAHRAFREKLGSSITFLSDFNPKGEVARAYGAFIDERDHPNRSLVLVGDDGKVEWVYESPTPLEVPPAELLLDALR